MYGRYIDDVVRLVDELNGIEVHHHRKGNRHGLNVHRNFYE
jgi:hypothetical protein